MECFYNENRELHFRNIYLSQMEKKKAIVPILHTTATVM